MPANPDVTIDDVRRSFRRLDRSDYPEVADRSWDEIYDHGENMAPGGLYLTALMSRSLRLETGARVLDVGCGRGASSVFLANAFDAQVVCFDLWTDATWLGQKMKGQSQHRTVLPMNLDGSKPLPLPDDYFDALFCMQALHSFGTDAAVLRGLVRHLRPGGRFVVGGTCFNQEPKDGRLPRVFSETAGWDAEYRNYHSPEWWKSLFEETRLVDVVNCLELPDGLVMWEDEVLYHGQRAGWSETWWKESKWLAKHLLASRSETPGLTHYVLTAQKKDWSEPDRKAGTGGGTHEYQSDNGWRG